MKITFFLKVMNIIWPVLLYIIYNNKRMFKYLYLGKNIPAVSIIAKQSQGGWWPDFEPSSTRSSRRWRVHRAARVPWVDDEWGGGGGGGCDSGSLEGPPSAILKKNSVSKALCVIYD